MGTAKGGAIAGAAEDAGPRVGTAQGDAIAGAAEDPRRAPRGHGQRRRSLREVYSGAQKITFFRFTPTLHQLYTSFTSALHQLEVHLYASFRWALESWNKLTVVQWDSNPGALRC